MKNKEIFKVGDTVYHWQYGKGEVESIPERDNYIVVEFGGGAVYFTIDGRQLGSHFPTLSFTPYDIVNGGFSQERPLPDIEVDTLVYVRGKIIEEWKMRFFSHFNEDGDIYCFDWQQKSTDTKLTTTWPEWSLTNPLEEK